jgi:hypothetical protein
MATTAHQVNSSTISERHVSAARQAVLSFFNAPPEDYVCIFTSNCTGALKLVGESFPFNDKSRLVLAEDSHNSVNGIRRFAESRSATVDYVPSVLGGGFEESVMLVRILFRISYILMALFSGISSQWFHFPFPSRPHRTVQHIRLSSQPAPRIINGKGGRVLHTPRCSCACFHIFYLPRCYLGISISIQQPRRQH